MFKRKINVYKMTHEQLNRLIVKQQANILEAQETLANALHAQEQIAFNINFIQKDVERQFGVKPAVDCSW